MLSDAHTATREVDAPPPPPPPTPPPPPQMAAPRRLDPALLPLNASHNDIGLVSFLRMQLIGPVLQQPTLMICSLGV
jgi:hypothetical protein